MTRRAPASFARPSAAAWRRAGAGLLAAAWTAAGAGPPDGPSRQALLDELARHTDGPRAEALVRARADAVRSAGAERAAWERLFLDLLAAPGATADARRFACGMLVYTGSRESLPALAARAADPELAHLAGWAMDAITGAPPVAARAELPPAVADAAALRAGILSAPPGEAAKQVAEALRHGGDARAGAALRAARERPGADFTAALAGRLAAGLEPGEKVLLLGILTERADHAAAAAAAALAAEPDPAVQAAALECLGRHGGPAELPAVLRAAAAADPAGAAAARAALARMNADGVGAALAAAARGGDEASRVAAIGALAERREAGAADLLIGLASASTGGARAAALRGLAGAAGPEDAARLAGLMRAAGDDRGAVEAALAAAAARSDAGTRDELAKALAAAAAAGDEDIRVRTARVLARAGGGAALDYVRGLRKGGTPAEARAAARALSDWADAGALPDLEDLAKAGDEAVRLAALRGYLRLAGADTGAPAAERLARYRKALALAGRPDEKRLAVAGIAALPGAGAAALLEELAADPEVAAEARAALARRKAAGPGGAK